tara:strand:- start:91 stop:210 length:120 start_codon:yes stop_codon:yes gene_type:complete
MILIKVSPGLEPGLLDSKSRVLTDCTTKPISIAGLEPAA